MAWAFLAKAGVSILGSVLGGKKDANGSNANQKGGLLGGVTKFIGSLAGKGMIESISGFIKSGFKFSCLGSQAFTKSTLDENLNALQTAVNGVNWDNISSVQSLADYCTYAIAVSTKAVGKYKSACSKSLREKLMEAQQNALTKITEAYDFTTESKSAQDQWEGDITYTRYIISGKVGATPAVTVPTSSQLQTEVPQGFITQYIDQIKSEATQAGIPYTDDLLKQVYQDQVSKNGTWPWDVSIGTDDGGNIGGTINFGNQPNNMMPLIILGGIGLLAYKILKK
ncbi:hypothetical protein [Chryseobacterium defluvii]|uniref:Uncharacterized protein n=1 Tax=Chryseobacterium defluvii TaxID=160396 RepID=A0A495SDC7_9FLAO|nr:hypothetical protein [Chryseobacterium defluvii]RKS98240.1 hypothetical protein BCF58_2381 [Chryseobacterium defluvii]